MRSALPHRVLVVRLGAIGDVTNALVFASALKAQAPETHIGWIVHDLALPLVRGHPDVDSVHLWPRGSGIKGFRSVLSEVRRERYDLAIDLQRITKSAVLARFSGAARVLGYDRRRTKEQSWVWLRERIPPGDADAHMVEQYLEVARHLGAPSEAAIHRLPRDPEAEAWAEAYVDDLGAAPVLINLGASKPANRWLPERFGALAGRCRHLLGAPVCFTGGPSDRSAAEVALASSGPHADVHDLVGETSLSRLIALARRACLFIGCDTGPMHIASACGTPTVALFGPASPRRTGPFAKRSAVVSVPPPCAPCSRRECNQPRHACMEDISIELVLDAALGLLETSATH